MVLCVIESFFTKKTHIIHFWWSKSECSRNRRMLLMSYHCDTAHTNKNKELMMLVRDARRRGTTFYFCRGWHWHWHWEWSQHWQLSSFLILTSIYSHMRILRIWQMPSVPIKTLLQIAIGAQCTWWDPWNPMKVTIKIFADKPFYFDGYNLLVLR